MIRMLIGNLKQHHNVNRLHSLSLIQFLKSFKSLENLSWIRSGSVVNVVFLKKKNKQKNLPTICCYC